MSVECFLDTNVLVYAAAGRGEEEAKRERAIELIENTDFGLSAQVLQEFYVTVVQKAVVPLTADQALEWIEQFQVFPWIRIPARLVKIAAELSERYRISHWDGAIVAAAQELKARILYTEDLNHEQYYGPVQVMNPFFHHGE